MHVFGQPLLCLFNTKRTFATDIRLHFPGDADINLNGQEPLTLARVAYGIFRASVAHQGE